MDRRVVETLLATRALDIDRCELDPVGPLQGGAQGFFRLCEFIFVDRRDGDAANLSNAFESRHAVWERLDCHPVAISRCLRAIVEISNVHFAPLTQVQHIERAHGWRQIFRQHLSLCPTGIHTALSVANEDDAKS